MAWFDGTFTLDEESIHKLFPNQLSDNLYADDYNRRAVIIVDEDLLKKDTRYITVQPFDNHNHNVLFYFPFFGKDVPAIAEYIKNNCTNVSFKSYKDQYKELDELLYKNKEKPKYSEHLISSYCLSENNFVFLLITKEDNKYTLFGSYKYVDTLSDSFDQLTQKDNEVIYIPLKKLKFKCPVCGAETLDFRGRYDICPECGWEDDGTNNLDDETLPNGSWTIRTYRINYFKNKILNPDYKAFSDDGEHHDAKYLLNEPFEQYSNDDYDSLEEEHYQELADIYNPHKR